MKFKILVFVISFVFSFNAFSQSTITVGTGGDYLTISAAIAAAAVNDIIRIIDAVHTEQDIQINKNLTIEGLGRDNTIIQAAASPKTATDRVFSVAIGFTATIRNCTIRHGYLIGGSAGSGPSKGGGIFNGSTLTLSNVNLTDNWVEGDNTNRDAYGGGIYNNGTLYVDQCIIQNNTAKAYNAIAKSAYGGGVYSYYSKTLTITNSTIASNYAIGGDDASPGQGAGGGLFLESSTILTLSGSTISGNVAQGGTNGTSATYAAASGGGLFFANVSNHVTVYNCTFSGNSAVKGNVGVGYGGGIYGNCYSSYKLLYQNCTIANNSASNQGGGIYCTNTIPIWIRNCIIADNTAPSGPDIYSLITSYGYNLIESTSGWSYYAYSGATITGNITGSDPGLSPLAVNNSTFGPQTHHISSTSPAKDAGTSSGALTNDQRGAARNGTVDIGAYEYWDDTGALPVELTSFEAEKQDNGILLTWETATEVNNYGFELQRQNSFNAFPSLEGMSEGQGWIILGFIPGHGNSNSPKKYEFIDKDYDKEKDLKLQYRLKQIDTDGKFEYYGTIAEVDLSITGIDNQANPGLPTEFILFQNYPNPFNPSTTIKYSISADVISTGWRNLKDSSTDDVGVRNDGINVSLVVYDMLGREVAALVNEPQKPGYHEVQFDGSKLSSGVYLYKLTAGNFIAVKKMLITK